jgi:hypothetical protein
LGNFGGGQGPLLYRYHCLYHILSLPREMALGAKGYLAGQTPAGGINM